MRVTKLCLGADFVSRDVLGIEPIEVYEGGATLPRRTCRWRACAACGVAAHNLPRQRGRSFVSCRANRPADVGMPLR